MGVTDTVNFTANPAANFAVPGAQILSVNHVMRGGDSYLLVGTIDAAEVWSLYRYHDSNSDGYPDVGTETKLFDTGSSPAYVTNIYYMQSGTIYLLDRRCQDICRATDANGDNWPDTVAATPFAKFDDYPGVGFEKIRDLEAMDTSSHGTMVLGFVERNRMDATKGRFRVPYTARFVDSDSNGVADSAMANEPHKAPYGSGSFLERSRVFAYAGATQLTISSGGLATSTPIEVWRLNAAGDEDLLLGSGALAEKFGTVTVSPALVQGDRIRARVVPPALARAYEVEVAPAWPQVSGAAPATTPVGAAFVATLTGVNFLVGHDLRGQADVDRRLAIASILGH